MLSKHSRPLLLALVVTLVSPLLGLFALGDTDGDGLLTVFHQWTGLRAGMEGSRGEFLHGFLHFVLFERVSPLFRPPLRAHSCHFWLPCAQTAPRMAHISRFWFSQTWESLSLCLLCYSYRALRKRSPRSSWFSGT